MSDRIRYDNVTITLHWLIAALIIGMLALGFFMEDFPPSIRFTAYDLHKATGITILGLSIFRLTWRLLNPPPALAMPMAPWRMAAMHIVHWLLYGFMVAMPLSGWLFSSAAAKYPLHYYGLGTVPFIPMPADEALRKTIGHLATEAHTLMGYGALALIAGHVGAALWHQFRERDGLILRMWGTRARA